MATVLIIGSGFAGATAANLLAKKGHRVTVVERAGFLGGGCKTHVYGGHPYTFGPRHFVTKKEDIFALVHELTPLRRITDHEFLTFVEGDPGFYQYPIHEADIARMPDHAQITKELGERDALAVPGDLESYWINGLGPTLYRKFVERYTRKMWALDSNTELGVGTTWPVGATALSSGSRVPWLDSMSAFPLAMNGYDDYFTRSVAGAEVLLETRIEEFDVAAHRVRIAGAWRSFDLIVSTISPEILLGNAFGPLRWMGRELWKLVLPLPQAFPPSVYSVYYANDEPFTRVVEYKKFYRNQSDSTLLVAEIPSSKNKLFPYPLPRERAIAAQYLEALPDRVFSIGRAGRYDYNVDIAGSIEQALELARSVG